MNDVEAFKDLNFWMSDRSLFDSNVSKKWYESLYKKFGLSPVKVTSEDSEKELGGNYEPLLIEVPMKVSSELSIIWRTDANFGENRTLLLRKKDESDFILGWFDSHGHPYCLRIEEAIWLSKRVFEKSNFTSSAVPFLLLKPFIGITKKNEADLLIEQEVKSLKLLGLINDEKVTFARVERLNETEEEIGNSTHIYSCGKIELPVLIQSGLTWEKNNKNEWELIAHKPWSFYKKFNSFEGPVPCHTTRARDNFKKFPEARMKALDECGDHDEKSKFPFEEVKSLFSNIKA